MQNGAHDYADKEGNGSSQMPSLQQVRTEGSITITPEMFERMYLGPQNQVKGDLRRTLGNPTPIGLGGFLIAYCPIIFSILGWRGYTNQGEATVGTYFFSGGLLAIISCILEFILGNTFPATFFGVFGGYFLAFGANIVPAFNAYAGYSSDPINMPQEGLTSPNYNSGLAFWNLMMAIFTLYCCICALRTNLIFFLAFFFLFLTFVLVASAQWVTFEAGKMATGMKLQQAGGACGFVVLIFGWYLLLALMLTTVDFPVNLPVFDLSAYIPSNTDLQKKKRGGRDIEKAE